MAKIIQSLILLLIIAAGALAQDRLPPQRRTFQPAPQLSTAPDSDNAAGLAQSPQGYALPLSDTIPQGSIVGIYGHRLLTSGATKVLLWSDSAVMVVDADCWRYPVFGLEMVTFRLPSDLRGDVWVTVAGRQASNSVKITVE